MAAYRASSILERLRNAIGMLSDVPPDEMDTILLGDVKVDDDSLHVLANVRAKGKEALAVKASRAAFVS